jgi:4a-hydroxytetrahydrobiopterin dehydratase
MSNLSEKKCIPCSGGVPPLAGEEKLKLKERISSDWEFFENNSRLRRRLKLDDFKQSIELANLIGEVAEEQWHHPELCVGYGHLDIEIWTHKINDLVESDFIFAAKVDRIIKDFNC